MIILNYMLFIFFINLCNSFTMINTKISPINRLNMGCDYYIDKDLHIYNHNDKIFSYISLEHERGYYFFISSLDEDEDGYNAELTQYIQNTLEPKMKPIIIYCNNSFTKVSFEIKYKNIIEDELDLFNKTLNDVSKIIKIENRYNRE